MKRIPLLVLAACAPDVPDAPSYQQHVAPILVANCVRCHGIPVIGGAPTSMRLDTFGGYEHPTRSGIELVDGAESQSTMIEDRVTSDDQPMPPRFPIDDYQIETLERWAALGAPRGAPNPGNRPPVAAVEAVEIEYVDIIVGDPDRDVVGGALYALSGATRLPIGLLRSGPNRIATTSVTSGRFELEAVVDDGGVEVAIPLGMIEVP